MSDTRTQSVEDYLASIGVDNSNSTVGKVVELVVSDPLPSTSAEEDAVASTSLPENFTKPEASPQKIDDYLNIEYGLSDSVGSSNTSLQDAINALDSTQQQQQQQLNTLETETQAQIQSINNGLNDEIAAREQAILLEQQARDDLSTSVTQSLAQASADIAAAHAAADQAAQDAANALTTAQAEIAQSSADAAAALATAKTDLQSAINATAGDLQTAINAVQASSDGVLAQLNTETTARQSADAAEVTARQTAIAGVQSDIGTVAAALTTESQTRATNDTAETTARQAAIATVQGNVDTVSAGLANEITSRANADTAETNARQTQVSQVQNNVDTVAAGLLSESSTRASADAAETSARQSDVSSLQGQINTTTAAITAEANTRATNDTAETNARTAAVSSLQGQINSTNAALTTESSTRATNDAAETSARQAAISSVQNDVAAANAAITAEANTRASADSAETSARQSAISSLQGALNTTNAALAAEATTRATNDSAETSQRQAAVASLQGAISDANAAIVSEANTRATNDSAETTARQAAVSSLQGQINTTTAALTSEASTRASADAAETSARTSAVSSLQGQIDSANAAIAGEQSTRASAISAEATARLTLSTTLSAQANQKRTFRTATEPTFAELFPPNVQACAVANLKPSDGTTGIGTWTNTARTLADFGLWYGGTWNLLGEASVAVRLQGAWTGAYECFDLNDLGQCRDIVPGQRYEFSVYTGAHRCRVYALILWCDASDNYIMSSDSTGFNGLYGLGGVNDSEKNGGNSLSDWKRLGVIAQAPAGATVARLVVRADNQGASAVGQSDPYVFACRPYFGLARNDQTTFTDWQPFQPATWIKTSENNKPYAWSGIWGAHWVAAADTRIDSNTTNISQLFSSTNGIAAMWGVQIDTNGKVIGRVQLNGSGGTSSFDVLATSFTVSMPGYSSPIFEVGNVGGTPKITMRADVIQDNSVTDGKVANVNLNAPTFASGSTSASVTVALRGGQAVAIIAKVAGFKLTQQESISAVLKQGSTTLASESPTVSSLDIMAAGGTYLVAPVVLLASYTPPSDGNYTFSINAVSGSGGWSVYHPATAIYVDRPYK